MKKTFVINTDQLVPGMVLAEDLLQEKTGAVLLKEGTVINESHLEHIALLQKQCVIYNPSWAPPAAETEGAAPQAEAITPLPPYINPAAQKIYLEAFETVKKVFSSKEMTEKDLQEVKNISENLAREITRDPQVLLQIAVLKAVHAYTFSHSLHVAIYATVLARHLGHSQAALKDICLAGLLHDLGKLDVPEEIVNKPGPLTTEEFEVMKKHVIYSYERLARMKNLSSDILMAISQHHEKINGTGYYQGLRGEQIHPWGKILATADVYDAVTTDRVYRSALLPHEGAEVIMGSTLDHLDYLHVQTFSRKIPFYPVGTSVTLNTGETGRVIGYYPLAPLRPIVEVETATGKKTVDLTSNLTVHITRLWVS